MEFVNQVIDQVTVYEDELLAWANPNLPPEERATRGWPLIPMWQPFFIGIAYIFMVVVGYASSAHWSPFNVKPIQRIYNPVQCILCSWMVYTGVKHYFTEYYPEEKVCLTWKGDDMVFATLIWVFLCSKVLDMLDTVFIILAQRWQQLSFLHCYHHLSILWVVWLDTAVGYASDMFMTCVMNAFVHVVMYFYYFETDRTGKKPWWKPIVTVLQLSQFVTMNVHASYAIYTCECGFPKRVIWVYLLYIFSLFILFSNFFIVTYLRGPQTKNQQANRKKRQ